VEDANDLVTGSQVNVSPEEGEALARRAVCLPIAELSGCKLLERKVSLNLLDELSDEPRRRPFIP
jgi:hypothetical protein